MTSIILIGISLGASIGVAFIDFEKQANFAGYHQYVSIVVSLIVTVFNIAIQLAIMHLTFLEN